MTTETKPLYLTENAKLQTRQVIDLETAAHFYSTNFLIGKPDNLNIKNVLDNISVEKTLEFNPPTWNDIEIFIPKPDWFQEKDHMESIHGIGHITRVILNTMLLARLNGVTSRQELLLKVAAGLHDIRRINDIKDDEHGDRAADWLINQKNRKKVERKIGTHLTRDEWEVIQVLVQYHQKDYANIPENIRAFYDNYGENHIPLLSILMDADKLERFRAPQMDWWPQDNYFYPNDIHRPAYSDTKAIQLLELAKYFCLKSTLEQFNFQNLSRRFRRSRINSQLTAIKKVALELGYIK